MPIRSRIALATAFAVLVVLVTPTLSIADTPTTYVNSVTTTVASISANSSVTSTAACGTDVLIGGGGEVTPTAGGIPTNALKLNGAFPSDSLGNPDGVTSPASNWSAAGGAAGQAVTASTDLTSYAMCLQVGPTDIQVSNTVVAGPTTAASWASATANCPANYVAVGGGALTAPASTGSLKPIGSFPGDASGNPVADGTQNPTSWTAVGLTAAAGATNTTTAFVQCAPSDQIMTSVVSVTVTGPETAGTAQAATAQCATPGFTVLLGGGVYASNSGAIPQQGIHLTGDFPSDAAGNHVTSGTTDSWTGVVQAGGLSAPGTTTNAFALCADPFITVVRPAATSGPTVANTEVKADAACTSPQIVAGGGVSLTFTGNGIHVNGTEPSTDGTSELTGTVTGSVASSPPHWLGISGAGGQGEAGAADTPFAMCFLPNSNIGTSPNITGTTVVMNEASGPNGVYGVSLTVATCPSGTRLLSGGARTTPASVGSVKPIASFPTWATSTSHLAAPDGSVNPDSWAAVGMSGGTTNTGTSDMTYAYAVCTAGGASHVTNTVHMSEVAGPIAAGTARLVTATCGSLRNSPTLVGGGAAIDGGNITTAAFSKPGTFGDHLTGTFPSDASGNPVVTGTTTATVWAATTHKGGMSSVTGDTVSNVWAMCVNTS